MLYEKVIRPFLFSIDPEEAHEKAISLLRISSLCPGSSAMLSWIAGKPPAGLETTVFNIKFPNPLGLAAGFDKDAKLSSILPGFGFGFMELGSITLRAQPGNPKPRMFRLPLEHALINRMGFNNEGASRAAERLKAAPKPPIPVGINIGLNADCPKLDAPQEYAACFKLLYPYGDYFVINVSCPNISGLRDLQERLQLERILIAIESENSPRKPILIKVAPDISDTQLPDLLGLIERHGHGIIATNTTTSRFGLSREVGDIQGGLSGQPLRAASTALIAKIHRLCRGKIPIIGVGGIETGADALEKIKAGASLLQFYTGFIYRGPNSAARILHELQDLLALEGFKSLQEAIGSQTEVS